MLTALDADVIKTYVELGMGVGIVAQMAYDPRKDTRIRASSTRATCSPPRPRGSRLRRGVFLRGFVYAFIALFAPQYDAPAVDAALAGRRPPRASDRAARDRPPHDAADPDGAGCRGDADAGRSRRCSRRCDARAVRDRHVPAGVPRDRARVRRAPLAVQQTLSSYLFAYAFMMLWHGALSDALGRRPIVLAGLVDLHASRRSAARSPATSSTLWLFRALQGLSRRQPASSIGRAIMRDRFQGAEAQRLMSQITLVFGVAPALAPVIGGALLNLFGWRSIFWMMLVFAIAVLAWAARALPETLPAAMRQPLQPRALWRNYRARAVAHASSCCSPSIPALNFAAFFIYIASAPAFLVDSSA